MIRLIQTNLRRPVSAVLALSLSLALLGGSARAASYDEAVNKLVGWGVINGYANGQISPERDLTRAEFVAMVNRAYGYSQYGDTPFVDVPENAWYHDDIGIGYNTGFFAGTSAKTASPNSALTREQTLTLLARNMRLKPTAGEVIEFADGHDFSSWSRGYARSAYQMGLVDGYEDATFRPRRNITRGEMAEILQRAVGTLVSTPGTHTLNDVYGNLTVNSPGVTLKDTTVAGNLYITGGLDLGDVTLENVRVLGEIVVAGGSESVEGGESVVLRNVTADALTVDSIADRYVSLRAEGNTAIDSATLRTDTYVEDRTPAGLGFKSIDLQSVDPAAMFTLSGNVENVVNKTPNSVVTLGAGTTQKYSVDSGASGTFLDVNADAAVKTLNLDAPTTVTGTGDVGTLNANATGSSTTMQPDKVSVRPGSTATVNGRSMDSAEAQAASLDPKLLAGYPQIKQIASASASAILSANKPGTIYWAVTAQRDRELKADDIVSVSKDDARVIKSGSVSVAAAETEVTASVSGLTAGTAYRFYAILQDSRKARSPVKSVNFTTTDTVAPAYASGYPKVTQITANGSSSTAQLELMANKNARVYYVLYPNGVKTPTELELVNGPYTGAVRSGTVSLSRNTVTPLSLSGMKDNTDYTLFTCVADNDNSRYSKVSSTAIKVPDGSGPGFVSPLPHVVYETDHSVTLSAKVNEDATIFWAAVPKTELKDASGGYTRYPTDLSAANNAGGSSERDKEFHIRQIAADSKTEPVGSVASLMRGNVSAKKDTAVDIVVGGDRSGTLTPGTEYRIFYLARDKANNYSDFNKYSSYVDVKTSGTSAAQAGGEESSAASAAQSAEPRVMQAPSAPVPAVTLSKETLNLSKGGKETLSAQVENMDGDAQVVWTAAGSGVHVSVTGEVTAIAPGEATVKATAVDGTGAEASAVCTVTVTDDGKNG